MSTSKRKSVTFASDMPPNKKGKGDKNGTSAGAKPEQQSPSKKTKKKGVDGTIGDPRFVMIRRMIEAQPTEEFQSMLISFAEKTLSTLKELSKKDSGVGKFRADDDYIPNSLDFAPPMTFPDGLRNDEETTDELEGWKEDLLVCKKALSKRIYRQAERNLKFWQLEFKKDTMRRMIEIGCVVAGREKIMHGITKSTANRDAIAKAAMVNFFTTIPWLEKFANDGKDEKKKTVKSLNLQ